jgi:hypothetical protein
VFTADAISADTVVRRYPVTQIETLASADARTVRGQFEIIFGAMSRMHSLLMILGRTTAEQKVGAFLLYGIVNLIVDAKAQFRSLAEPWADSGI